MSEGSHSLASSSTVSGVIIATFPFVAFGAGRSLPRTYLCVGVRGVGEVWRVGFFSMSEGALCWYSLVATRYHPRPRCLPRRHLGYDGGE